MKQISDDRFIRSGALTVGSLVKLMASDTLMHISLPTMMVHLVMTDEAVIKCDYYTGTGSTGLSVNVGFGLGH